MGMKVVSADMGWTGGALSRIEKGRLMSGVFLHVSSGGQKE